MIVSRVAPFALRASGAIKKAFGGQTRLISTTVPRKGGHGTWAYRSIAPAEKKYEIWAEAAGAFMWWWIFWHLFTDYEHLTGHYAFPDYACWTDEELGIPPDDAEDPEPVVFDSVYRYSRQH